MKRKYSIATIESLIKSLDGKLEEKIEIIAIGGTALALLGRRFYSKDIDICHNCKSSFEFAEKVIESARETGIDPKDIGIFYGFEMSLLNIPDFSQNAIPYEEFSLKNIILKVMHPTDIILSKIYRGEPRDIKDAKNLLDRGVVTLSELETRFIELVRAQRYIDVRREFIEKYRIFIEAYRRTKNREGS